MTERAKRGAGYDDIISAPDDKIAESVGGDLYLSPRPRMRHSHATAALTSSLHSEFHHDRADGWWILYEPEVWLFGDVLVPDLAGWKRTRLPELPDASGVEIPPDWICEVLSPSTERFDRNMKLPLYAHHGVSHAWVVDLTQRRLEIYERDKTEWRLLGRHSGITVVSAPPFEAAPIDLSALWT